MFTPFLTFIGLYVLLFYFYDILKAPILVLIYRAKVYLRIIKPNWLQEQYGNWAAITGATDGIGKAYARELALRGFNIILISRNQEKLKSVAYQIENDFQVRTKIIEADFTKGIHICPLVEQELNKTDVRILINNVGQTTAEPGFIANFSDEELWNVIFTNIPPVTQLSRYFIRRLSNAGLKGLILNVSSVSENIPVPYGAVYAASKAYTRSLTLALREEAEPYGIAVHLLSPHFVITKINDYSLFLMKGNFFIPDAETYARSAVQRLGLVDQTTGYFAHDLELAIYMMFPWRVLFYLSKIAGNIIFGRGRARF